MPIAAINAQGSNHAITGTSADGEDLIVTVTWQDSVAAGGLEIAVFDENDLQIAGQLVWPIPGEQTQSTFDNFLHNLPESGFQFSTTVRDSAGRDVLQPHAFRVVIECPRPVEPCQWRTQDGLYTNALATSESLMATLDALEAERSSDLLADALKRPPDLRGPVFSLAAQIDRLDQQLDLGNGCFCAWNHYPGYDPDKHLIEHINAYGAEQFKIEGKGAAAAVAGQTRFSPMYHPATATGTSRQTLELSCWKIHDWVEVAHLPVPPPMPPQTIRFPIMEACPDACRGTVKSSATIGYCLSARLHDPMSGLDPFARAAVDGLFERDNGADPEPWQAELLWAPVDTDSEQLGTIHIPTEGGVYTDDNIREMTTTLSGDATVELQGEAFGIAEARFHSLLWTKGHAGCAIQPTCEAELRASNEKIVSGTRTADCGEPLIDPWVP